tara:strand:- start:1343 stop:1927 length:585 start_codon:yes stop_codon:yes gene_type:complete
MDNIQSLIPTIEKLLNNLILSPIKGDYDIELVQYPNNDKGMLLIEVRLNVAKVTPNHKEYDKEYADVMWYLEDNVNLVYKYLGMTYNDISIGFSPDYYNYDFLNNDLEFMRDGLYREFKLKGYSDTDIDNIDLSVFLNLREDDAPWVGLEVSAYGTGKEGEQDTIEDLSYELLSQTKYLSHLIDDDISFWISSN